MKQANVKVGHTYFTYIGTELCPVEVLGKITEIGGWNARKKTTFRVRRVGENKPLPKRRTAAALRE